MSHERSGLRFLGRRLVGRLSLSPLASEAAFELMLAMVLTRFSERWYFRRYRLRSVDATVPGETGQGNPDPGRLPAARRAALIGHVVRRMAEVMPVGAVCLQQSLATLRMLSRRGMDPVVLFGVRSLDAHEDDGEGHEAHAWVVVEGIIANGARSDLCRFAVVGRYR